MQTLLVRVLSAITQDSQSQIRGSEFDHHCEYYALVYLSVFPILILGP